MRWPPRNGRWRGGMAHVMRQLPQSAGAMPRQIRSATDVGVLGLCPPDRVTGKGLSGAKLEIAALRPSRPGKAGPGGGDRGA
jgi:hypothetical protein